MRDDLNTIEPLFILSLKYTCDDILLLKQSIRIDESTVFSTILRFLVGLYRNKRRNDVPYFITNHKWWHFISECCSVRQIAVSTYL